MRLRYLAGMATASLLALNCALAPNAQAAPAWEQLKPDKGYATISVSEATPGVINGQRVCIYRIAVTNPKDGQAIRGLKGLLVYSKVAHVWQNDRADSNEYKFHGQHEYSRWEIKGPADDHFVNEGQTDDDFLIAYPADNCPSACDLSFAIKAVGPTHNGGAWFQVDNVARNCDHHDDCAQLTGRVTCGHDGPAVQGATVKLMQGAAVLQTVQTGADGGFAFSTENPELADDTYTISVTAGNDLLPASLNLTYACTGSDIFAQIAVMPKPIKPVVSEVLCGKVFFSDRGSYVTRATSGQVLTEADLYNGAFASPSYAVSYEYQGVIPGFPELGAFGGQRKVYLFMEEPLVPGDRWNGCMFTNQIGVRKGVGTASTSRTFVYRTQFNLGLTADSATAYNFKVTGIETDPVTATKFTPLTPVRMDGVAAPLPPAGQLPPGWMARASFEFELTQGGTNMVWAVGDYKDICGHLFPFRYHPPQGGGPID